MFVIVLQQIWKEKGSTKIVKTHVVGKMNPTLRIIEMSKCGILRLFILTDIQTNHAISELPQASVSKRG